VTPVVAHAGHWLVDLLYALPVLAFGGWLLVDRLIQRRRDRRGDEEGPRESGA